MAATRAKPPPLLPHQQRRTKRPTRARSKRGAKRLDSGQRLACPDRSASEQEGCPQKHEGCALDDGTSPQLPLNRGPPQRLSSSQVHSAYTKKRDKMVDGGQPTAHQGLMGPHGEPHGATNPHGSQNCNSRCARCRIFASAGVADARETRRENAQRRPPATAMPPLTASPRQCCAMYISRTFTTQPKVSPSCS